MIACAADTLLAAPFSIVGSIGVIAGVPNVHRLLERGGVEYVQRTAGEYKRTVNIFTPNTEEGLQKFEDDLSKVGKGRAGHPRPRSNARCGGSHAPASLASLPHLLSLPSASSPCSLAHR